MVDSRCVDVDKVWRRRKCADCGHRFTTEECEVIPQAKKTLLVTLEVRGVSADTEITGGTVRVVSVKSGKIERFG